MKNLKHKIVKAWRLVAHAGNAVHCPLCGWSFRTFMPYGDPPRENAFCPRCHSLERHRLLQLFMNERQLLQTPTKLLHVAPEESAGILVTEAPLQPKQNRERMAEILFGTFNAPNVYVAIQAVMSLYSAGRTNGLVVDSGDGVTHTVPVFEGYSIPHAIHRIDIAGRVLTDYMRKLLQEAGENFTSSSELEIVKDIKEKLCYVALDWEKDFNTADTSSANDASYTLPDKRVITVPGTVRMKCPELLFQPTLNGKECLSMHALTWKSTQDSDIDVRKTLLKNVILSGGSTMYENLPDRLKQELLNLAPSGAEIRIVASADRKFAVWKGASTLASLSSFAASWVSKEEFEEHGGAILHRKCA